MRARAIATLAALVMVACGTSSASPLDAGPHAADAKKPTDGRIVDARAEGRAVDAAPSVTGPALPVAPVGHEGRWLTDALGRVLLVHGVNVVAKSAPYTPASEGFSDGDATWLADSGFRVVRVGVLATGLMPTPGVVDQGYVQQIRTTVQDLASHDIFSVIDLHQDGWGPSVGSDGFPAWMTLTLDAGTSDAGFPFYYEQSPALQQAFQSFWDDGLGPDGNGLEEDYAAMFSALASALAGEPHVLGYDLLNEPWPGKTWMPCLDDASGCPALEASELAPAYAKAVAAIRAAGDHHLVFGEPFVLFNFGVSTTSLPLPGGDPAAGLSFHAYPLVASQATGLIANAVAWSESTHGALLNTEWGATTNPTTLTSESLALDSALVPWIFWSFCCELVPSLTAPPGGTNLVPATAAALIQPYPLAVAGTPTSLTIEPSAQTLSFTWSTARADGGTFAPGTVTTFEAPALTYPHGYTATVTHGAVTSAPCAPLLTVTSASEASTVSVDLKPGGACP